MDEIPFDFTRRRMSVVVEDVSGKRQIITKGAVEEMMQICSHTEVGNRAVPFTPELRVKAYEISKRMNRQGLRVLAVAHKSFLSKENNFAVEDESGMVLIGFLAFLDPPKQSAAGAIRQLHAHGIEVKVVSGDNDAVVRTISRQVGIDTTNVLTGAELSAMNDEEKREAVARTRVFAKVTPMQKTEIIALLQTQGNTVGFLGDGINDAAALRQSDIGISVDSAVDIAKESADIILLEKDLMVLENGVIEGRRTFGNIIKYVKMTAGSNFGNMFSVMAASASCPSCLCSRYTCSCRTFCTTCRRRHTVRPHGRRLSQQAAPLGRLRPEPLHDIHGPISSIFDITTYLLMWHVFGCSSPGAQSLFQSGWFVEGLLSQTLIVHMIRTKKIPFIQSRASWPVMCMTLAIMAAGIIIPFTRFGSCIGLTPLPLSYFPWLAATLIATAC